jgi:hypothetical protein
MSADEDYAGICISNSVSWSEGGPRLVGGIVTCDLALRKQLAETIEVLTNYNRMLDEQNQLTLKALENMQRANEMTILIVKKCEEMMREMKH